MQNAKENLHGLWRSHKGLMVLLVVGLAISLLAVLAPQAWATPGQSPLRQTTTDVEPEPPDGECFRVCDEPVRLRTFDDGFTVTERTSATVYITLNITWTVGTSTYSGTNVNDYEIVHQTDVTIDQFGQLDPNPVTIWSPPLELGFFDIFVDVNQNGYFDNDDAVYLPKGPKADDPGFGAGLCVDPCPVGGTTLPNQARFKPWWVALAAFIGGGGVATFVWRRRRL